MYASTIFYAFVALSGVMATPVQEPEVQPRAIGPRMPTVADIPFPMFPSKNPHHGGHNDKDKGKGGKGGKGCSQDTVTQTNACSSGKAYCCNSNDKGHVCSNTTACESNVICCNNNNGFQICIGDIDFNVPITINIYE